MIKRAKKQLLKCQRKAAACGWENCQSIWDYCHWDTQYYADIISSGKDDEYIYNQDILARTESIHAPMTKAQRVHAFENMYVPSFGGSGGANAPSHSAYNRMERGVDPHRRLRAVGLDPGSVQRRRHDAITAAGGDAGRILYSTQGSTYTDRQGQPSPTSGSAPGRSCRGHGRTSHSTRPSTKGRGKGKSKSKGSRGHRVTFTT